MKIYKFTELKAICSQQGMKLARLENAQGEPMTSYNKIKTPISKQFTVIQNRLRSEILPDGLYYVCLAPTINKTSNPDRYPIQKGRGNVEMQHVNNNSDLSEQLKNAFNSKDSLLTSAKALEMLTTISDLKAQVKGLQLENEYLQQQIDELENEPDTPLEENKNNMFSVLQEQAPAIIGGMSEWFKVKNRELDLKEKEYELKKKNSVKKPQFQKITIGSPAHLALIQMYFDNDNEKKFEEEMEKLKAENETLYNQVYPKYYETEEEEQDDK